MVGCHSAGVGRFQKAVEVKAKRCYALLVKLSKVLGVSPAVLLSGVVNSSTFIYRGAGNPGTEIAGLKNLKIERWGGKLLMTCECWSKDGFIDTAWVMPKKRSE